MALEPPYQYGHLNEHPMYPIGIPPIPPPQYLITSQKPSTLTYESATVVKKKNQYFKKNCHVFLLNLVVLDYHHLETHVQSPYSYIYRSKKRDFPRINKKNTYQHGVSLSRVKINLIEKKLYGFLQHLLVYFYILWLQRHYFTNGGTTLISANIHTIIQKILYQIIYFKKLAGMNN